MTWEAAFTTIPSDTLLRSLFISKLIDLALADVVRQQPRAPVSLLSALQQSLTEHATEYYEFVADQFDQCVTQVSSHGFSAALGKPLFFACPQRDGSILELFPYGSCVAVTEENHKRFLQLIQNMKQKVPIQLRDLPVSPKLHSGGNYYPLTRLIIEHMTNTNSDWCIDNEDWDALDVVYSVPFNGHVYDISPGERNERVSFENARSFGINARRTLLQLMEASRNSLQIASLPAEKLRQRVWMMSRGYLEFLRVLEVANTPLGNPMSVEEFNSLHLTYSVPLGNSIVPLIPGGEDVPVEFEKKDHFVSLSSAKFMGFARMGKGSDGASVLSRIRSSELPPLEKAFWDAIEGIRQNPEMKSDLSFVIKVMNQTILLKENGGAISVTRENVQEYIDLICEKRDLIHAAFVENDIKRRMTAAQLKHPPHSAAERANSLECHPPWKSPLWNTFILEPSDLRSEVFEMMQCVKEYRDLMTPEEYGGMFFSFAIPIRGKGLYQLLPRGDTIPVTWSNHEEFLERLGYEIRRLQAADFAAQTCAPCEGSRKGSSGGGGGDVEPKMRIQPGDCTPSVCAPVPTVETPKGTSRHWCGDCCAVLPETMKAAAASTLDELDVYENNLLTLKKVKDRVSIKVFEDFSLRYALMVGGQEVELLDGGRHRFVAVQELDNYVDMAIRKLNEIRGCMLAQNRMNNTGIHTDERWRQ